MASDARPGRSRHFRGGRLEDDHVYAALMRERDEARERERRALAGRNEAMTRLAEVALDRDEARAEAEKLRSVGQVKLDRAWAECDEARAEAARYQEALERIATEGEPRKLALQPDAQAFQRIALDALAERARALRGGDGHE